MTMTSAEQDRTRRIPLIVVAWAWVGLPLIYGVYELIHKVTQLFGG
jgi:hypothetical protein